MPAPSAVWRPYCQMATAAPALRVASAEGALIRLEDGRELVDGIASWWTAVHGYRRRELLDAARAQLEVLPHVMLGGLTHEPVERLAVRLRDLLPMDEARIFFSESGSVAVEVAMKIAAQYWRNRDGALRTRFVSFKGGYHGDTFAAMSVCDPDEGMHTLFSGAFPDQHVVDLPQDAAALTRLEMLLESDPNIAGVIVEPLVQGAGGMRMHAPNVLALLRQLCDRHGPLLIFDEIFTGFGRTGDMFAAGRSGVSPDIMTLGKALTGGVCPLAATAASRRVHEVFDRTDTLAALMHGPTYSGHALGCAVANASLDLFAAHDVLADVRALEARAQAKLGGLAGIDGVRDVRCLGAISAVEMVHDFPVDEVRAAFIARGVFVRPIGRVIYLTPSYAIDDSQFDLLAAEVSRMVRELAAAPPRTGERDLGG